MLYYITMAEITCTHCKGTGKVEDSLDCEILKIDTFIILKISLNNEYVYLNPTSAKVLNKITSEYLDIIDEEKRR